MAVNFKITWRNCFQAVRQFFDIWQAYTLLRCGNVLIALGRNEEALAAYDAALELYGGPSLCDRTDLDANRALTQGNRSLALGNLGRHEEALAAFQAALMAYGAALLLYRGTNYLYEETLARTQKNLRVVLDSFRGHFEELSGHFEEFSGHLEEFFTAMLKQRQHLRDIADLNDNRSFTLKNCGVALVFLKEFFASRLQVFFLLKVYLLFIFGRYEKVLEIFCVRLALFQGSILYGGSVPDTPDIEVNLHLSFLKKEYRGGFRKVARSKIPTNRPLKKGGNISSYFEVQGLLAMCSRLLLLLYRYEEALECWDAMLVLYELYEKEQCGPASFNRVNILLGRCHVLSCIANRVDESLECLDAVLVLCEEEELRLHDHQKPTHIIMLRAYALAIRADILISLQEYEKGLVNIDAGLELLEGLSTHIDKVDYWNRKISCSLTRVNALTALDRHEEALKCFDAVMAVPMALLEKRWLRCLLLKSHALAKIGLLAVRIDLLRHLGRYEEALDAYKAISALQGSLNQKTDIHISLQALTSYLYGSLLKGVGQNDMALEAWDLAEKYFGRLRPHVHTLNEFWFSLLTKMVSLLAMIPTPSDWARERSQRMALALELVPSMGRLDGSSPKFYKNLRGLFVTFHARWLAHCFANNSLDEIPTILMALQGRKLARQLLDELDQTELDLRTPEAIREFKRLRLEIRRLDTQIRGIVAGGRFDSFSTDSFRSIDPMSHPLSSIQQRELDGLMAARNEVFNRYVKVRQQVADQHAEYQLIEPYHGRLQATTLAATLATHQALLLLLDIEGDHPVQGVLVLKSREPPRWYSFENLHTFVDHLAQCNAARLPTRGLRKSTATELTETPAWTSGELERQWSELVATMAERVWSPLNEILTDITEVIAIGHGRLHLLPLEAGAPAYLRIRHYPGLLFYAQHHGLLNPEFHADLAPAPPTALTCLGSIADPGSKRDIPFTLAEDSVLDALWRDRGATVLSSYDWHPLQKTGSAAPPQVLHIACHGSGADPNDPDHASLLVNLPGVASAIHMPSLLAAGPQPEQVILSACLAAQTAEDLDGDPLGLVSAWFFKGARQLVGAISPVPDLYMPVFAALLHQALLDDPQHSLITALHSAQRRIGTGDWVNDPKLADLLRQNITERLGRWYWEWVGKAAYNTCDGATRGYANDPTWGRLWQDHLVPRLNDYGLAVMALAALERDLLATPKPSARQVGRLIATALVEHLFAHPIPPAVDLATFRYAVRCYG